MFDETFAKRIAEADEFYDRRAPEGVPPGPLLDDLKNVQRQAFAGLLWTKQFYYYYVRDWLRGDPHQLDGVPIGVSSNVCPLDSLYR